jgi:mycothiol synthase
VAHLRAASWDDLDDVYALLDARSRAAFGTSEVQLEHLRSDWEVPSFDLARDAEVAIENGRVVGYAALESTQELVHATVDDGLGDELLRRMERRARERGFDHVVVTVVPTGRPLQELVRRSGFVLDREVLRMWKHLSPSGAEPVWPDGLVARTFADADGEALHARLDEAYAGWDRDYVARPHDDWLKWMTDHGDFDRRLWFLVERDRELVAAGLNWKEHRGDGWVKDIVVRESERGRGLGKALLLHAFAEYRRRGARRVGLKVDSGNPTGAVKLYERTGFETDRRYGIWVKRL